MSGALVTTSTLPLNPVGPIVRLTPTTVSRWKRCRRQYLLANVLPVPAVDRSGGDAGSKVHALLRQLHTDGSCRDAAWREEVVSRYDSGDGERLRGFLDRHVRKCPEGARAIGHELGLSRLHRRPPPIFMVYGSVDAVWEHDGLLDARDYKTFVPGYERVDQDAAAHVQAFLLAPLAAARGLDLRIKYEVLAPEAGEDPVEFSVDADRLGGIEERLRRLADEVRDEREFAGVGEPAVCRFCPYRSICTDAVLPAEETPASA